MRFDAGRTRENLITEAMLLCEKEGWGSTSARAIRNAAGVSNGSWLYAFKAGKQDLGPILFKRIDAAIWDGVISQLDAGDSVQPSRLVRSLFSELAARMNENRGRARLWFELGVAIEAGANTELRARRSSQAGSLVRWARAGSHRRLLAHSEDLAWALLFGPPLELCRQEALGYREQITEDDLRVVSASVEESLFKVVGQGKPARRRAPEQIIGSGDAPLLDLE